MRVQQMGFLLLAVLAPFPARAAELSPGRVLERVPCRTPGHSYALYLPSKYPGQKRWPVIVCFDPGGNGAVPVRLFRDAAEERGWIVVGSNNSRNGPFEPNIKAAQIIWDELGGMAVDERRVYTAGFSGGAQMALLPAASPDCRLAGVLACSNKLPDGISPAQLHRGTVYFTVVGIHDFNYWPVMDLSDQLRAYGLISEHATFAGPHAWPPADLLRQALEWFDVQASRNLARPRDEELAKRVRERSQAGIRQLEKEGLLADALEAWERLSLAWRGMGEVPEAEARIRALRDSPPLRKAQNARAARRRREMEGLDRLVRQWARLWRAEDNALPQSQRIAALGIRSLRRSAAKKKGTAEGDSAQRLLGHLLAQAQGRGYDALGAGRWDDAVFCFAVAAEILPGHPLALYNLACANCRAGERHKALQYLQQAVDAGFRDLDLLSSDEDLKTLRGDPAFVRLVERLRAGAE
ncbi:MAG: hypothetical protein JXO51_08660 [Candidatus Aminicenantes bacterium]|nr:hypothetical protein [Candidatus Aminicenantes bacterium]